MKESIKSFLVKNRNNSIFKSLNRYSTSLSRILNCEGMIEDFEQNGEAALLRKLSQLATQDSVVLDVGANVGNWAESWLSCSIESRLYCFEIVPKVFEKLESRFVSNSRVIALPFGLSDTSGKTSISYISESDSGSSLNVLPWTQEKEEVEVEILKGDDFVRGGSINEIFFLKIDTEGHELNVLKGFKEMLRRQKIVNIQFEYGYTYIPNRVFLADVYQMLSEHGFRIGSIYPEGVDFKDYDIFRDDDFKMRNYFATLSKDTAAAVQLR